MIFNDTNSLGNMQLDYHFSKAEISALAIFLRKQMAEIPAELNSFCAAVERTVYDSLSIDEAEHFYS